MNTERDEDIARMFLKAIGCSDEQVKEIIEYFLYL